jgi:hypothetical protein
MPSHPFHDRRHDFRRGHRPPRDRPRPHAAHRAFVPQAGRPKSRLSPFGHPDGPLGPPLRARDFRRGHGPG